MIKPTTFIAIILLAALAFAVFHVEHRVEMLHAELKAINKMVKQDKEAIHVLDAEWSYLNQPQRLKHMSTEHLSLTSMRADQIKSVNDIPFQDDIVVQDMNAQFSRAEYSQR